MYFLTQRKKSYITILSLYFMVFDFIDDGEDISQALVAQTYHHPLFFSLYCMVFDFIDDGEDISQALVAQTYHHPPPFFLYIVWCLTPISTIF